LESQCVGLLLKTPSGKMPLAKVISDYNEITWEQRSSSHALFPLLLDLLRLFEQGTDDLISNTVDKGASNQSVSQKLKRQLVSELAGSYEISFTKCPSKSKTSPFSKYIYAVGEIFNFSIGNGTIKPVISK
jgi:hypothetical protein